MNRTIIDIPRVFMRPSAYNWRIDWRGQSAGADTAGGEQIVYNRFPRWVGAPQMVLPARMIGHWRALMARGEGRCNAYRVRMVDPALLRVGGGSAREEWEAYVAGVYDEPRPKVLAVGASVAGDVSIVVDERAAPEPVMVGAFLSHNDWPFLVTGRSGSGAEVTLQVKMLRAAIPDGAQIDLYARGLFVAADDATGDPAYGVDRVARPEFSLIEWITR